MILDFFNHPEHALLHEVADAATGEVIDEPIFYADDDEGFYRRYVTTPSGGMAYDHEAGVPDSEEIVRPIRIVPRLERLCVSLRASLAEAGVSADDIPEPVLGALALFQERLQRLEAFVATRRESIPRYTPRSEEEIRRLTGASSPAINSAQWLESVTRPYPDTGPAPDQVDYWLEIVTRLGLPWTRADMERFLPEVSIDP